ncbi:amino acid transporter [Xylariomycetidae sp. FL0641]|nr:amino acid transporter [Xylariomycetidae sp. FL0641]
MESAADSSVRQPLLGSSSPEATTTAADDDDDAGSSSTAHHHPEEAGVGGFGKTLGTGEAFAIVVSIVIGSGVFTSPGSVDAHVAAPGFALVVWLVGGVLAWTGASTMAELGCAIPGEGGVQPYLQYIFGEPLGFLAAWTWLVAVMPATLAILSIVFVESIFSATGHGGSSSSSGDDAAAHKLLAMLVLAGATAANCVSTRASTRLNRFFVAAKFGAVAGVVLAGAAVVAWQARHPDRADVGGRDWFARPWFGNRPVADDDDGGRTRWDGSGSMGAWELLGHYATALYGALWAYSGWDKAIYVSAELSAPARQLPLAINTAIPTIVLCFLAANAAYYVLLPWDVVSSTDSVAVTAITRLLGRGAGIAAAVVICLVVAGSLLGNAFVAGRMAVAAAHRGWIPAVFGELGRPSLFSSPPSLPPLRHPIATPTPAAPPANASSRKHLPRRRRRRSRDPDASDAPVAALLLTALLAALYVAAGDFRSLLTFNGLGEYAFFFLAVAGAVVLRFREPRLPRPYRPLVLVPALFAVVAGFVVVRGAVYAPLLALVLVVLWAAGLAFYAVRKRGAAAGSGEA